MSFSDVVYFCVVTAAAAAAAAGAGATTTTTTMKTRQQKVGVVVFIVVEVIRFTDRRTHRQIRTLQYGQGCKGDGGKWCGKERDLVKAGRGMEVAREDGGGVGDSLLLRKLLCKNKTHTFTYKDYNVYKCSCISPK